MNQTDREMLASLPPQAQAFFLRVCAMYFPNLISQKQKEKGFANYVAAYNAVCQEEPEIAQAYHTFASTFNRSTVDVLGFKPGAKKINGGRPLTPGAVVDYIFDPEGGKLKKMEFVEYLGPEEIPVFELKRMK